MVMGHFCKTNSVEIEYAEHNMEANKFSEL